MAAGIDQQQQVMNMIGKENRFFSWKSDAL